MHTFSNLLNAQRTLEHLREAPCPTTKGWDLAKVLHHAAQSVEYSLDGFPRQKNVWFQATVGAAAFAVFSIRGTMRHGLEQPIPGAPDIAEHQPLAMAVDRMLSALHRFDSHNGPLAPHFAYGKLNKAQFTRAHLMHLADHWQLVQTPVTA